MDERARLERIRTKIARLKELEAECGYGVVLDDRPSEFEALDELPPGVAVYGLFRELGGNFFRFSAPPEIRDEAAWEEAGDRYESVYSPLPESVGVGDVVMAIDPRRLHDGFYSAIGWDIEHGFVYYVDGDDIMHFSSEDFESDIPVLRFTDDLATFIDEWVLGQGYPDLVRQVLGYDFVTHRVRKGQFTGELTDTWLRLLARAGLADPDRFRELEIFAEVLPRVPLPAE